jgi:hypothetical protein
MTRHAHLKAAQHHIEAACKHLAAAGKHHEGEHQDAEKDSEEARLLSKIADDESMQAHSWSAKVAKRKLV